MYVVSNLRKFKIEVLLVDKDTNEPALENQLQLRAVLLYENGCVVKATSPDEELLLGVLTGPDGDSMLLAPLASHVLHFGPNDRLIIATRKRH